MYILKEKESEGCSVYDYAKENMVQRPFFMDDSWGLRHHGKVYDGHNIRAHEDNTQRSNDRKLLYDLLLHPPCTSP